MTACTRYRFALAWLTPVSVGVAAWGTMLGIQTLLALAERVPAWRHSPPAAPQTDWHRFCLRLHVPLQAALLFWVVHRPMQSSCSRPSTTSNTTDCSAAR